MRQALLEAVAQAITIHSVWARVASLRHWQRYLTREDGQALETVCRCMTLEATRSRRHHRAGQRWQIPEPDLDKALSGMRAGDEGFRQRCSTLKPTPRDVDMLILRATNGAIDLQMAGDGEDFVPKLYKPQ